MVKYIPHSPRTVPDLLLSLHDALPIFAYAFSAWIAVDDHPSGTVTPFTNGIVSFTTDYIYDTDTFSVHLSAGETFEFVAPLDRKRRRLNSSQLGISYAGFHSKNKKTYE